MRTRVLAVGIAALLVAGTASAVTRLDDEGPPVAVVTDPGGDTDPDRRWDAGAAPATATTVASTSSVAQGATTASPRRGGTTATTASPKGASLVSQTARVDQAGVWVVRRDGTGLRRVEAQCSADHRQWLSESQLVVVRDHQQTALRLGLDGSTSSFPQPTVTDPSTGQTAQIRGVGSLSPDRRMMAISFGGAWYGVSLVDLTTGEATVIQSGDNPLPTWSPSGEILLVGPSGATLVGPQGVIHTTSPSPVGMSAPWLRWSPDGRRIAGVPPNDYNSWVVLDPWTGATQTVPDLGPGGTADVEWGDGDILVVREKGIDHQVEPSTRAYDLATGRERVLAEAATWPKVSPATGVVAFQESRGDRTIGVVSLDGSRRGDLVTVAEELFVSPHSWSPSGDLLLFDVCTRRTSSGGLPST